MAEKIHHSSILRLPDELLIAIASDISESYGIVDTIAFGSSCRRAHKLTRDPTIWKQPCLERWRWWDPRHDLTTKTELPPGQTDWYGLYVERHRIDSETQHTFNEIIATQHMRPQRMWQIASRGYDVEDVMQKLNSRGLHDADAPLARKYYAEAILGLMHRRLAIETWSRMQQGQPVALEEALGAFDRFVFPADEGVFEAIQRKLDHIAQSIKDQYNNANKDSKTAVVDFDSLSVRQKVSRISQFLTMHNHVGIRPGHLYHNLENNFIGLGLSHAKNSSLPLQSAAIFSAVAGRLGVEAHPCNFPGHIYVVVQPPPDQTLDGEQRQADSSSEAESMYMDPFDLGPEVPEDVLRHNLMRRGISADEHALALRPATTLELVTRTGRNILTSINQPGSASLLPQGTVKVDHDLACYAMLWSKLVRGDVTWAAMDPENLRSVWALFDHIRNWAPADVALVELISPLPGTGLRQITEIVLGSLKDSSLQPKAPRPRATPAAEAVQYKVGHYLRHRRFGYEGFIVGWDARCMASDDWVDQMGVRGLPRGVEQPFYNVMYVCTVVFFPSPPLPPKYTGPFYDPRPRMFPQSRMRIPFSNQAVCGAFRPVAPKPSARSTSRRRTSRSSAKTRPRCSWIWRAGTSSAGMPGR